MRANLLRNPYETTQPTLALLLTFTKSYTRRLPHATSSPLHTTSITPFQPPPITPQVYSLPLPPRDLNPDSRYETTRSEAASSYAPNIPAIARLWPRP